MFASEFFENGLFVWFAGALLLFGGLLIIAFHQYWSSAAAVIISLFGWILALRGLVLMADPKLYERAARGPQASSTKCQGRRVVGHFFRVKLRRSDDGAAASHPSS